MAKAGTALISNELRRKKIEIAKRKRNEEVRAKTGHQQPRGSTVSRGSTQSQETVVLRI